MKNLIKSFLSFLLAGFLYWGLAQYTDAGTIDPVKLLLTPEPWFLAVFFTIVMLFWGRFKTRREAKKITEETTAGNNK